MRVVAGGVAVVVVAVHEVLCLHMKTNYSDARIGVVVEDDDDVPHRGGTWN